MSKLETLIDELCPLGVEYNQVKDICKISNGKDHKDLTDGDIPVYGSGGVMRYVDTYLYNKKSVLIPRKGSIGNLFYLETPFWAVDTTFYTVINEDLILPKFFYYYLATQHLEDLNEAGGVPSLTKAILDKVKVPLPPLPIQREIVQILDNFTLYAAELTAELTARRKQYGYYRNELLTFNDDVEWKTLGEVCKKTNNIKWADENETHMYIDLTSVNRDDCSIGECITINANNAPDRAKQVVLQGDILFGTTRPTLRRFCEVTLKYDGDICSTGYCILRANSEKVNRRWIFHNVASTRFDDYVEANQHGASYPAISDKDVKAFPIPLPPLAEQERIIAILDRFDTLTNDITSGLPAEIEARRKQYGYYRDKLLQFRIKNA